MRCNSLATSNSLHRTAWPRTAKIQPEGKPSVGEPRREQHRRTYYMGEPKTETAAAEERRGVLTTASFRTMAPSKELPPPEGRVQLPE